MNFQFPLEALLSFLALVSSLVVIFFVIQRRGFQIARPLLLLVAAAAFWLLTTTLEHTFANLDAKVISVKLQYISVGLVPVLWFLFALDYTGDTRLLSRWKWLLIEPLLMLGLVWTNEWHGLWWLSITPVERGDFLFASFERNILFGVHVAYAYLLVGIGTWLLIRFSLRTARLYRGQAILLAAAAIIPWLGNVLYLNGLSPTPFLDLTPIAFSLSNVCLVVALAQYHLIDLTPVNPLAILDSMTDGVVVLDQTDRIVNLNTQAATLMGIVRSDGIGQSAAALLPGLSARPKGYATISTDGEIVSKVVFAQQGYDRTVEMRILPLQTKRQTGSGRVVILRDVTEQERAQENLRCSEAKNRALLETIPDQMALLDKDGIYIEFKPAWDDENSAWPGERVGRNVRNIFAPELSSQMLAVIDRALETGEVQSLSYVLTAEKGARYFDSRIVAYSDEAVVVTVRNVTESREEEQRMQEQRLFLQTIVDSLPESIFIKDSAGRYQFANQVLATTFEMPVAEIVGRQDADFGFFDEAKVRDYQAADRQVLESGMDVLVDQDRALDSAGNEHWFRSIKRRIFSPINNEYQVLTIDLIPV